MRNFDPERFVLTFRNRDYEINEVVKAMKGGRKSCSISPDTTTGFEKTGEDPTTGK
jgi:hypothetical protein